MKRFISGFVAGAIVFGAVGAFAASYVANPVGFKVLVNGQEFVSDPPALEVEGRTYLPLRAIGDALGVPVGWNEELGQAEVGYAIDSISLLQEVRAFYVNDIWNNGFCDISWYISDGTNSVGNEMDIEFALAQLDKAMEKKAEYDSRIEQLEDSYFDIKLIYKKMSDEANRLYKHIKDEPPVANNSDTTFSTGLFVQYSNAFENSLQAIIQ